MTNILSPRFGSLFYLFRIVLFFKYFYSISLTLSYFSRVNDNSWLFLVMPCRSRIKCKLFGKSQLLFLTLEDNINAPFCGYWEFKGCKLVTSGFLGGPWVSLNYLKLQPLCTQVTLSILLIYIPLLKMPFVSYCITGNQVVNSKEKRTWIFWFYLAPYHTFLLKLSNISKWV